MATITNSNASFERVRGSALRIARASEAPIELIGLLEEAQTWPVLRLGMAALAAHVGAQMERLAQGFVLIGSVAEAAKLRVLALHAQMDWEKFAARDRARRAPGGEGSVNDA